MKRAVLLSFFFTVSSSAFAPSPIGCKRSTLQLHEVGRIVSMTEHWEIRDAVDSDLNMVQYFLDKKAEFDRGLNGQEKNSALEPKPGTTLQSLFPSLPNGKIMFISNRQDENSLVKEDPIGFCMYQMRYQGFETPPLLWMEDLFVDPSVRSKGAGKAMMDALADKAQESSCSHLAWKVDFRNERGLNFYTKLGADVTYEKGDLKAMEWIPTQWGVGAAIPAMAY